MSWTRGLPAALAVCVLLLTGSAGCGTGDAHEGKDGRSASPVGRVLEDTDEDGRHYREVQKKDAPEVGIEVQPDADNAWDVRLTVRNFRFSAGGAKPQAVAGRGLAYIFVDDRLVTRLRGLNCRLPARLVPRGTHHVTARLYADDGTVWAVKGEPIESTADITASEAAARPGRTEDTTALSASRTCPRTGGRGSPERAGKAS
ncbi:MULTISPECIES: hypothetical protein [Streptomyces]|uniref:Secreted protein n=1 Tax=Streptomyces spinosisporus TaxID=2927582 RepID=A0ABS9XNI0_9ACTN|nr:MULTISPECIES: hypothetical protein [Streptomyces]MCI3243644.1 hypothetical protein [Streptomyces spinosisporus]WUB39438.1 hypothetical protein OHN38_32675 [Streptomyces sp. NBC_00588]